MEQEKKGYTVKEDTNMGSIKIADDVVARIAAIAAMEVEGIHAMAGNVTADILQKAGVKNLAKGARVEILNRKVKIELAVVMEYGYNIPATCQYVQNKVKNAVENMTALEVTDVNVRIAGVNMGTK